MGKMKIIAFISIIIFFLVVAITAGMQGIIERHEQTHQAIFNEYGIESNVKIGFLKGSTVPKQTDVSAEDARQIKLFSIINELVTYQFLNFYLLMSAMMAITFIVILAILIKGI